jgi:phospholipase/carboxylesterase
MSIRTTLLSAIVVFAAVSSALAANELPMRTTPIPETTNGVPHVQIGIEPVPEISEALLKKVATIPGVDIRNTVISLPGALGFWIKEDVTVARPEVIVGGREFAHIHPDGSLHASLPPALAQQAVETGWAVSHPWANQRPGWEGFVMIFTPTNKEELDVVLDLVQASFDFVTRQH